MLNVRSENLDVGIAATSGIDLALEKNKKNNTKAFRKGGYGLVKVDAPGKVGVRKSVYPISSDIIG
jgi:hypothetical protein